MTPQKTAIVLLILVSATLVFFSGEIYKRYPKVKKLQPTVDSTLLPKLYPYPVAIANGQITPDVSAKSAVVVDVKSGTTLYQKNPKARLLPASTTKLMTAIVALERCQENQVVAVTFVESQPTSMGLETGDVLTVKSLLYGLLISSGNDAAFTLAASCAATIDGFVREMNSKALELNLLDTHFANPAGFDDPAQFTTAYDLARLARVAVANPLIAKIVATRSTVVTDVSQRKTYYLQNINELLNGVQGVSGIKTGQTEGSHEVLVTQTTRDDHTIVTVVLGSEDRFEDSKSLIEWAFANHQWVEP